MAFLPDGDVVAPVDRGSVAVWDPESGERIRTIGPGTGGPEPLVRIAVNQDGTRLATVRNFTDVGSAWDPRTGELAFEFRSGGEITGVDWSPDGDHLLVTDLDGAVTVFDATGKKVLALNEQGGFGVETGVFSPNGGLIATSGRGRSPAQASVTLWDVDRGRPVKNIATPGGQGALAFDPSGASLATGRFDGFVDILDVETGERVLRFPATEGRVEDVAYSPDGETIATAGDDGTVRLFDARTGKQLLVLRGHRLLVSGIAFSPDGTRLVSASPDGLVRVWALVLDDLIRIAREEVTRDLSDDECRQYLHLQEGCA